MPTTGRPRNPWFWTVLTLLHERPMHPYEMQQLARRRGKDVLAEHKAGSLYSVIGRLQAEGLIAAESVERDGRLPERTVYRITDPGRSALREWLHAELGGLDARDLPRFGFALEKVVHLDPTTASALLATRAAAVGEQVAALEAVLASARGRGVPEVSVLEIDYARDVRAAELGFLRGVLGRIGDGRLTWTPAAAAGAQP